VTAYSDTITVNVGKVKTGKDLKPPLKTRNIKKGTGKTDKERNYRISH